jgi:hypothetical protein
MQGASSKQDNQTERKANEVADKLNRYIADKGEIPKDLKEASITDVPSSITYSRKSDKAYEVCVEYKAASVFGGTSLSGIATGLAASELAASSAGGGLGSGYGTSIYDYDSASSYAPAALYFYGGHKQGKNCQTVEPYQYSSSSKYDSTNGSDSLLAPESFGLTKKVCSIEYSYGMEDAIVKKVATSASLSGQSMTLDYFNFESEYEISSKLQVFDKDCKALTLTNIKVGDKISAYYPPYDSKFPDESYLITVIQKVN